MPQYQYVRTNDTPEPGEALMQVGTLLHSINQDAQRNQLLQLSAQLRDQQIQAEQARTAATVQNTDQKAQNAPIVQSNLQKRGLLYDAQTKHAQNTADLAKTRDNFLNQFGPDRMALNHEIQSQRLQNLTTDGLAKSFTLTQKVQDAANQMSSNQFAGDLAIQVMLKSNPDLANNPSFLTLHQGVVKPQVIAMVNNMLDKQTQNTLAAAKLAQQTQHQGDYLKALMDYKNRSLDLRARQIAQSENSPSKLMDQTMMDPNASDADRQEAMSAGLTLRGRPQPMTESTDMYGTVTKKVDDAGVAKAASFVGRLLQNHRQMTSTQPTTQQGLAPQASPPTTQQSSAPLGSPQNPRMLSPGALGRMELQTGKYRGQTVQAPPKPDGTPGTILVAP